MSGDSAHGHCADALQLEWPIHIEPHLHQRLHHIIAHPTHRHAHENVHHRVTKAIDGMDRCATRHEDAGHFERPCGRMRATGERKRRVAHDVACLGARATLDEQPGDRAVVGHELWQRKAHHLQGFPPWPVGASVCNT